MKTPLAPAESGDRSSQQARGGMQRGRHSGPLMNHRTLLSLASAAALATAQPASARDAGQLQLQGQGPYFTVALPMALRSQSASPGMEDLRVLNAQGEPLPFAWAEPPTTAADEQLQRVPFFKLPEPPAPRRAASAGAPPDAGWMIDARRVKGTLTGLELELPDSARGVYTLALDASSDLQQWRPVLATLQIVSLQQQGLRLRSTRIELDGQPPGYLRLRVLTGSTMPPLKAVQARSVSQAWQAPPLQWSEAIAPLQCDAQHCDYALPRRIPLEQAQWQLADVNSLARVLLLGAPEASGSATTTHHHRLRDKMKALRHKTRPEEAASAPAQRAISWRSVAPATLYWLRVGGADLHSGPIALDGGQYEQLRLQPEGAMSLLGSKPPVLRIAARTRTLVFLARGTAPYRLSWAEPGNGSRLPGSVALPLDQLMPARHAGDALPTDTASVQLPAPPPPAETAAVTASSAIGSALSPMKGRMWLWGVLVAGVALMGVMAYSLLRGRRMR